MPRRYRKQSILMKLNSINGEESNTPNDIVIEKAKGVKNAYTIGPRNFKPPKKLYKKWSYWTCSECGLPLMDKNQVRDYFKNHVDENGICPFCDSDKKGLPKLNICMGLK